MIEFLKELIEIIGESHVKSTKLDKEPYLTDSRKCYTGKALAVVFPQSTKEISSILKLCSYYDVAVVPQGGNTGRCVGATPICKKKSIVVNLANLNRIYSIDIQSNTIDVGAGCVLEQVKNVAREHNRLFPLTLGAQGTCQIGGNIATNAGGQNALRYGSMRSLVLGLEVVLPSGAVWNGLRQLRKNNTGYDLKHLFIASEGTLGIITRAILKLYPKPSFSQTFFCALKTPQQAIHLLNLLNDKLNGHIERFELIPAVAHQAIFQYTSSKSQFFGTISQNNQTLEGVPPWSVLIEITSNHLDVSHTYVENILDKALEEGYIDDVLIGISEQQKVDMWRFREDLVWVQKDLGYVFKHDIAVPIHDIPEFLQRTQDALSQGWFQLVPYAFGHLGDGNIHYNVIIPFRTPKKDYDKILNSRADIHKTVYDIVDDLGGTFSAEHGIGRLKNDVLKTYRSVTEIQMMHSIKEDFDPQNIMNPGVFFKEK